MKNLKNIISKFPKTRVLVIGDLILDQYIWGTVDRVSPEAPVPVVWAKKRTYVPGGAANVANNIRSLGGEVSLIGVVGKDLHANTLLSEIKKRKIDTKGIFVEPERSTTIKSRIIAGHQQIVRVDWEHTEALSKQRTQEIFHYIKKVIDDFDAIIIEDYGKGVVNMQLLSGLVFLARSRNKIVTVDPKEDHFQYYVGVSAVTPNRKELENAIRNLKIKGSAKNLELTSDRLFTDKDIDLAGKQILKYLELESLLVTLGEHGMRLFEGKDRITHIPTVAQEVFDVSGAGDTVIATFTLALAAGATKLEAAHLANFAAGIVVGKVGTAATTGKELMERIG